LRSRSASMIPKSLPRAAGLDALLEKGLPAEAGILLGQQG